MMRFFLLILILTFSFQSWTKADDISEFEIEGMSVGDSLLDFFTEKEINTAKNKEGSVSFKKYLDDGEIIIRYLYSEEAPRDEDAEARLVFWNDT